MGNQHGTKLKPTRYRKNWDASTASPRTLVPQKRRRKLTAGPRQAALNEDEQIRLHRASSSIFGEKLTSSQLSRPVCRMNQTDASLVRSLREKRHSPFRKDFTAKEGSDSDLSEYDNEWFFIFNAVKQNHETAEVKAAAQRVMTKIEEVEGILRRVRVTSSEWAKEDSDIRDKGAQASSRTMQKQPEFNSKSGENRTLIVEELYATLSQSLHGLLKMEGGKAEIEDHMKPPSRCYHFTHAVPSSARAEFSPPTLSESSSYETLSPILSSPLPPRLSAVTDQQKAETFNTDSDGSNSGNDSPIASEARGGKKATRTPGGAENETQEPLTWKHYLLSSEEALQRQEDAWQQEVEESLSHCRSLFHPSRPKHIDFLRITADDEDITDKPAATPHQQQKAEASTPEDGEERTPGRLHTVWPPLKEEKVGLKYTEAEHQADLLQLKRECKDELEKLQKSYELELSTLREENKNVVSHLEIILAELQDKLCRVWTQREQRDAAVSTASDFLHKTFRTAGVQTDRETFVKNPEEEEDTRRAGPKNLDMFSISLSMDGQKDDSLSSSSSPLNSVQTFPPGDSEAPPQTTTPSKENTPSLPPPPPPPLRPGAAPPPPPPPVGGLVLDKPPRKPAVEPSRPMKPLYWTRIQIQDDNNKSLWNILDEPRIINASEFEDLFAKSLAKTKRKPLSEAYEKKSKARKIIKLLDSKRSQAVGILISSLHLEMKDIQQAVLSMDHSVVDLDAIEALYENRAQPEELEKIRKHYETSEEEDVKLLDKPEQFLYELSQIHDFAGRAWCIIFKSAFIDGIAAIKQKLNSVSCVCEVLLESNSVREVIGLVLALGNHMNGGSRIRGQADGFGMEILPKLKDVKSKDNRISLVDYVVSYYLHNIDKNSGTDKSVFPLPEPPDVFVAAQVKLDDLSRDLQQLKAELTKCEKSVEKVCSDCPEDLLQPFKDQMEVFLLTARKEHADASYQLMNVEKSFQDLVLYFGLKPKPGEKEVMAGHLFMFWFEFCADFKARWKRENKNISKERLKEAQLSVKRITGEKKVETRRINPNSLKDRLRQKETNTPAT